MLRPLAIQSALEALVTSNESPADVALVVLSESGTIYAQAHLDAVRPVRSKTNASGTQSSPARLTGFGEIDRQQRQHQPGLASLMSTRTGVQPTSVKHSEGGSQDDGAASSASASSVPMSITLTHDDRARVLAGTACQAWSEEVARVRRLRTSATGRFSAMASSTGPSLVSGGSGGTGSKMTPLSKLNPISMVSEENSPALGATSTASSAGADEESDDQEGSAVPVAILGTPLRPEAGGPGVAPLLLEAELGALVVLPLHPQGANVNQQSPSSPAHPNSATLLLVLAARSDPSKGKIAQAEALGKGNSVLSQSQWNEMHNCAQSFATFIAPALRKAFGRSGELLPDDHPGVMAAGGTTIFSDDHESSASVEASHVLGQTAASASGISVP